MEKALVLSFYICMFLTSGFCTTYYACATTPKTRRPKTVQNVLTVNLAFSIMVLCSTAVPMAIAGVYMEDRLAFEWIFSPLAKMQLLQLNLSWNSLVCVIAYTLLFPRHLHRAARVVWYEPFAVIFIAWSYSVYDSLKTYGPDE